MILPLLMRMMIRTRFLMHSIRFVTIIMIIHEQQLPCGRQNVIQLRVHLDVEVVIVGIELIIRIRVIIITTIIILIPYIVETVTGIPLILQWRTHCYGMIQ